MTDKASVSSSRLSLRTPLDMPFDTVSIPTTRGTRGRQNRQTVQSLVSERTKNPKPTKHQLQRMFNKRISSYSLNKTMNGSGSVRYLHINSRHLPRTANQEQFSINLLEPIRNASHMELTAFSVANDFSNILPNNNKLRMLFKRHPDTGITALNDVYMIEVELEEGFYTHGEMIDEILAQITTTANGYYDSSTQTPDGDGFYTLYPKVLAIGASSFANQTTYGVLFKPTHESNGKTSFDFKTVSGTADGLKYVLLSYPYEQYDELFHDSILHRLGYTKNQIYFSDENISSSTQIFLSVSGATNSIKLTNQRVVLDDVVHDTLSIASPLSNLPIYSRHFSVVAKQKYTSAKLAFETHSHLRLTCDLIHDIQETTYNYKTLGKTEMSDVLCEIPVENNRASWIHYLPNQFTHLHKIDNPLIRNFKIGLKNPHNNRHFKNDEHKQFQISLKIYIMDDESIPNQEFFDSIKQGEQNFSYRN